MHGVEHEFEERRAFFPFPQLVRGYSSSQHKQEQFSETVWLWQYNGNVRAVRGSPQFPWRGQTSETNRETAEQCQEEVDTI